MNKKYLYIILLSLFSVTLVNAQMGKSFGSKKQGGMFGKSTGNNKPGPFGGGFGKSSGSSSGSNSGSSSGSRYGSSSEKYGSSSKGNSRSSGMGNSSSSSKSSLGSSSDNSGLGSSSRSSSGASSVKAPSMSDLRKLKNARSYPGIGKSKALSSVKAGTRYSYPGIHNMRNDINKMKKQAATGKSNHVSQIQ